MVSFIMAIAKKKLILTIMSSIFDKNSVKLVKTRCKKRKIKYFREISNYWQFRELTHVHLCKEFLLATPTVFTTWKNRDMNLV